MNKIDVQQVDVNNVATRSDALTPLQIYQQKVASGEIERAKQKSLKEKWEDDKTSLRKKHLSYVLSVYGWCQF